MRFYLFILALTLTTTLAAQTQTDELLGAWESSFFDAQGRRSQLTMTITPEYMVMTAFNKASGEFISTLGGRWRADYTTFSLSYDFDSTDSTNVGGTIAIPYRITGSVLIFNNDKFWTRTDRLKNAPLAGAWQITGRKRDGVMQDLRERAAGPRKTVKILSGSRFQWIAFDTQKKKFIATGGGSYSTSGKGLYIERIEYFSRDPARARQQLSFDFKRMKDDWVHRGLSSRGEPIHEVWSKVK